MTKITFDEAVDIDKEFVERMIGLAKDLKVYQRVSGVIQTEPCGEWGGRILTEPLEFKGKKNE